jgi:hypothetical protein
VHPLQGRPGADGKGVRLIRSRYEFAGYEFGGYEFGGYEFAGYEFDRTAGSAAPISM